MLYLTVASPETLDVFNSFQSTQADEAKLQKHVTEIRALLHSIRKWNVHKRNIFYQRIQKEGDIIKVFVTDLILKSNKGMRRGKERGKETAWVSDKRWNHIKDERKEWNSRETKNWQWKILKADNLLDLIRQGNHRVQPEFLLFTINPWKILKIMRFLQLLTICFNKDIGQRNRMKKTLNLKLFIES